MGFQKSVVLQEINFPRQYTDCTPGDAQILPTDVHGPTGWAGEMGPI